MTTPCTAPTTEASAPAGRPLLSLGAPWPGAAAWRPCGWRTGLEPAEVAEALADLSPKRGAPDPDRVAHWRGRGVGLPEVKADAALLRDCWTTDEWVWRLAEEVVGPPAVDPYWNPWAATHLLWSGVRLLDGRDGRDGFDPALWGRGTAFVNWPHSDSTRGMAATAAHVRAGNAAAVVAPLDGCEWVQGATAPAVDPAGGLLSADLASADLLVLLGRLRFRPPPGISESSPRGAYWLALFGVEPERVAALAGRRLWVPEAGREVVFLAGAGDCGDPVAQEAIDGRAARRKCGA